MPTLVVTTPASNRNLTTVDAVKLDLGLTGGAHDDWIASVLPRISARVETYCERIFARETVTETWNATRGQAQTDTRPTIERLEGTERPSLRLSRTPTSGTPTITLTDGEDTEVLETDEYSLDPATGLLLRLNDVGRPIYWPAYKIDVAYTGGYLLPDQEGRDLPYDLEGAAIDMVKLRYHSRLRDPSLKSETVDLMGSQTFWMPGQGDTDIPETIRAVLDGYRRISVA